MTTGMVSGAKGGSVWISAPIQKGNSGGPVFDAFGNILGLVNNRLSTPELFKLLERQGMEPNDQDGLPPAKNAALQRENAAADRSCAARANVFVFHCSSYSSKSAKRFKEQS